VEVKGHGDKYSKFLIFLESIQESRAEQSAVQEDPDRKTATAEIDMSFFSFSFFFVFQYSEQPFYVFTRSTASAIDH
jgi:hypothetical protein